MAIFGWIIAAIGTGGLVGSVILEVKTHEPIYMTFMKVSCGLLGIGGIIVGVAAL